MKTALFANNPTMIDYVYAQGRRQQIADISQLLEPVITDKLLDEHQEQLAQVEAIFSTWSMFDLTPEQLARMPRLKGVFYAAGSVRHFAHNMIDRDIAVVSAWGANAFCVAEFTLSQILLAGKGYWRNMRDWHQRPVQPDIKPFKGKGNYGHTVALLGAGQVGRRVMELLRHFKLDIAVYDPFLSDADAARLGARKVSLKEAFAHGYVVSNHMPNLPETTGIINRALLASMPADATFINTGRGASVVESDLVAVMTERPDLTALLDVTDPEPPLTDSPLYGLPNVHLTSHIAGAINEEVVRMADCMIEEFQAFQAGKPLRFAVTKKMLETMA